MKFLFANHTENPERSLLKFNNAVQTLKTKTVLPRICSLSRDLRCLFRCHNFKQTATNVP